MNSICVDRRRRKKNFCFLVSVENDELPCAIFDTYEDAMKYIGVSSATLWRMLKTYTARNGYLIEKVFLDNDDGM